MSWNRAKITCSSYFCTILNYIKISELLVSIQTNFFQKKKVDISKGVVVATTSGKNLYLVNKEHWDRIPIMLSNPKGVNLLIRLEQLKPENPKPDGVAHEHR